MRADFPITIKDVDGPLTVQVKVHEDLRSMHAAISLSDRKCRTAEELAQMSKNPHKNTQAVCQRFNMQALRPLFCIVRFVPENIGAGIVAHEMAHAAIHLWDVKHQWKVPLRNDNDEWFAWILGELVRRTVNEFYERGIYTDGDQRYVRSH